VSAIENAWRVRLRMEWGSAPKSVEKERGASSDVIALENGFHRSPYSHDLEVT
jgi:hypothetical protein